MILFLSDLNFKNRLLFVVYSVTKVDPQEEMMVELAENTAKNGCDDKKNNHKNFFANILLCFRILPHNMNSFPTSMNELAALLPKEVSKSV